MEIWTNYLQTNKDRFLEELLDLLRIPSVSADSKHKDDVRKAAEFVADKLTHSGAEKVEICETKGHPIVYGEKIIDPSLPTILVYGHYDVQPPDPLDLWESPPFQPVIKKTELHPEGAIYARGSCDDKGQMYMHIKAFEMMMSTDSLPCNVKFMLEGEEEVGSDNLGHFVKSNKTRLEADVVLISDTSMLANDTPSIDVGLRGLSYMELEITGPNRDLHSGVYGGAVANPANILADIISSLHDENRHITIPGFYDDVLEVSSAERVAMAQAPFDENAFKTDLGVNALLGERGFSPVEHTSIRPMLMECGVVTLVKVLKRCFLQKLMLKFLCDWSQISNLIKYLVYLRNI